MTGCLFDALRLQRKILVDAVENKFLYTLYRLKIILYFCALKHKK